MLHHSFYEWECFVFFWTPNNVNQCCEKQAWRISRDKYQFSNMKGNVEKKNSFQMMAVLFNFFPKLCTKEQVWILNSHWCATCFWMLAFNNFFFFLQIFNSVFKIHLINKTIKIQSHFLAPVSLVEWVSTANGSSLWTPAEFALCLKRDGCTWSLHELDNFHITASDKVPLWMLLWGSCEIAIQEEDEESVLGSESLEECLELVSWQWVDSWPLHEHQGLAPSEEWTALVKEGKMFKCHGKSLFKILSVPSLLSWVQLHACLEERPGSPRRESSLKVWLGYGLHFSVRYSVTV